MSRQNKKFFLDKEHAKISGVCAGMVDYFGWDTTIVRVGWVVLTIVTGGWPILAYVIAAWLADAKPRSLSYYDDARAELDSARRDAVRPARAWHFSDVKNRFDRVEDRLRTLEQVVTSREFQMDRELRGTGRV
jgi:phage shock protein C